MALGSRGLTDRLTLIAMVLFAFGFFSATTAMAGSGWEFISPSPSPEPMLDVDALDATHVVAVGKDGQILRSTDGGANWSFVPSGVTRDLLAVDFVNSSTGWAVGDWGVVLKTTDGGATWIPQTSESDVILRDVSFGDENHGWAVGWPNVVLQTADGGQTWSKVDLGITFGTFTAVDSPSADLCVIAPGLNVTRDGGLTWTKGTGVSGRYIEVADSLNWFVTSYPSDSISLTKDGGLTWQNVRVIPAAPGTFNETNHGLLQLGFADALHGWVKINGQGLAKTSDGGLTWTLVEPQREGSRVLAPHTGYVSEMACWGSQQVWTVGYDGMTRTSDGGATWTDSAARVKLSDMPNAINGVAFADRQNGWLVGRAGLILRTNDNGDHWTLQSSGVTETVSTIECFDANTAIAGTYGGTILRTTDGGATWTKQLEVRVPAIEMIDIAIIDSTHAVVDGGWSYRTEDAGVSWTLIPPIEVKWTGTAMNVRNGVVYSPKGYSIDGGMTWNAYGASVSALSVDFLDSHTGWAAGVISGQEGCSVRKTTDGGASWTAVSVPAHERARSIKFVDGSNGWIIGERGMILRTSDGGANWLRQKSSATATFMDSCFVDSEYGWVTGSSVMRTTTGGWPAAEPYSTTLNNGVRLEFDSVLDQGRVTAVESSGQAPPPNFRILRGNYFEISTSAQFTGFVDVTIPYNESDLHGLNESNLKLMHWKNNGWEDITVSIDTDANTITGRTDSFSPFAVMGSTGSSSEVSTPASSPWSSGMMIGVVCLTLLLTTRRSRMRIRTS